MLAEFVAARGWSAQLASVRTVAPTGAEIAADPEAALAMLAASCRDCAEGDGADCVILGGAGLVGLAERIAHRVPVPVLCSVATGIDAIHEAARQSSKRSPASLPPVGTTGLSPALARIFGV